MLRDSDKLFDVIAVNLCDHKVRIMATDLTAENSEAFVNIAIMRRGVEEEFFAAAPAGLYRTGDTYTWKGMSEEETDAETPTEGSAL